MNNKDQIVYTKLYEYNNLSNELPNSNIIISYIKLEELFNKPKGATPNSSSLKRDLIELFPGVTFISGYWYHCEVYSMDGTNVNGYTFHVI